MDPSWGHLGPILGPSLALLGPSGGPLGPSWSHLGPSGGHLGDILGLLKAILGPSWAHLRARWALFNFLPNTEDKSLMSSRSFSHFLQSSGIWLLPLSFFLRSVNHLLARLEPFPSMMESFNLVLQCLAICSLSSSFFLQFGHIFAALARGN